ncbi:hypothetical protein V7S78_12035 [Aquirufa regiilacus]
MEVLTIRNIIMKNSNAIFPDIDYHFWLSQYNWDNIGTVRRMITNMRNRGYLNAVITPENITNEIKTEIQNYLKGNDSSRLRYIFLLIQTWGGASARIHTPSIYEQWEENETEGIYLSFVNAVLSGDYVGSFHVLNQVHGIGPSFIAKHICFWSGKGDRQKGIPILDDVIAKTIYARRHAIRVSYGIFIGDFEKIANEKKLKPAEVEMALFAFCREYWETAKTATWEFKPQINENSKDYDQAMLIVKRFMGNNQ